MDNWAKQYQEALDEARSWLAKAAAAEDDGGRYAVVDNCANMAVAWANVAQAIVLNVR